MEPPRWNIVTPSQYEWERRGLDFIRTGLPDHDPYRAWTNFEFQTSDGAIYEVGLHYIDIKVAKAIARAMEQAGIRPSQRSRRVGDCILGDLIADGPGYQDRLAKPPPFKTATSSAGSGNTPSLKPRRKNSATT
jgi:hypothetical protein